MQQQVQRRYIMTRLEFFKSPQMSAIRNNIKTCAVLGYVLAGLTLYFNVIKGQNYFALADVLFLLVCSLLIHFLQSRAAAIVFAAYAAFTVIYTSTSNGKLSGWWVVLIAVYAIIFTFRFQKAWAAEKADNEAE